MLILGIDSAGSGCSACVWRDGKVLAAMHEPMERGQDQRLMPLILEVMKKAGVEFEALDRIASTRGPGSFTGIRIGLAAARGIGLAADKPVIGIDRFAIYREQVKASGKDLLVVIDSKRKEFYCRFYPASGAAHEPAMMTADEIVDFLKDKKNPIVVGDINLARHAREGEHPSSTGEVREMDPRLRGGDMKKDMEAITCAALAARVDANDPDFLPRPLYIRPPDVTRKKGPVNVRAISADDASMLSEMHIENFDAAGWNVDQMQGSLALATTRGWVALIGDQPAGFILCQITPEQSEVLTFCVSPAYRRKGIGEKLLRQAIDAIQAGGNAALMLEAAADNIPARKLYEKLGFTRSGKRANYYRHSTGAIDAIMYNYFFHERRPTAIVGLENR